RRERRREPVVARLAREDRAGERVADVRVEERAGRAEPPAEQRRRAEGEREEVARAHRLEAVELAREAVGGLEEGADARALRRKPVGEPLGEAVPAAGDVEALAADADVVE